MLILVNDDLILNGRCDVLTTTTDVHVESRYTLYSAFNIPDIFV